MTITRINPAGGAAGDLVSIFGTDIDSESLVRFALGDLQVHVAPASSSADLVTVAVPEFGSQSAAIRVSLVGEDGASNSLPFALAGSPAVETIYPFCSLGALKAALGVSAEDTVDDVRLTALIAGASITIARECGRDFRPITVVDELADGDGSSMLALAHVPILSVQAISIDGQALDPTLAKVYPCYIRFEESDEYLPRLRGASRIFPKGLQNVCVSYTAGYGAIPADLSYACIMQAIYAQNTLGKQGILSETNSVANATTQYAQVPIAPAARGIVNRYRRPKVAVV